MQNPQFTKKEIEELVQSYVNDSLESMKKSHEKARHSLYVRGLMFLNGVKFKPLSKSDLENSAKEFESVARVYIQECLALPQNYFN